MTSDAAMDVLADDLDRDVDALEQRLQELTWACGEAAAALPDLARHATLAVALHAIYGAVEGYLQRVALMLDGALPEGPRWHTDLLERMARPVTGARPAVLGSDSAAMLRRLLAFRHFFRPAYGAALDGVQLEDNARPVVAGGAALASELRGFAAMLRSGRTP
jgi:hypothetical protein